MDYRDLNAITVKDSFPISIVDELLDELNGVCRNRDHDGTIKK